MLLFYSNIVFPKRAITAWASKKKSPSSNKLNSIQPFDIFNIFSPALAK